MIKKQRWDKKVQGLIAKKNAEEKEIAREDPQEQPVKKKPKKQSSTTEQSNNQKTDTTDTIDDIIKFFSPPPQVMRNDQSSVLSPREQMLQSVINDVCDDKQHNACDETTSNDTSFDLNLF